MNIGFDLDQVLISYPPLVPHKLIDWLYRNHSTKKLSYRIPKSRLEQLLRKWSHFYKLRPPIQKNIDFILNFPNDSHNHTLYLISSRFGFLEKITHNILKRYKLASHFSSINLNVTNSQPHLFKEKIINELKINLFVDDDLDLLKHLQKHCPNTKLLWYNPRSKQQVTEGITKIKDLTEVGKFLK